MMGNTNLSRRSMLQLTGGTLAGLSAAGSAEAVTGGASGGADATFEAVDANLEQSDLSGLRVSHLVTPSRGTEAVIWKDDSGTVHADGTDSIIASSGEFCEVLQAAVDEAAKVTVQAGKYELNETVHIPSNTTIEGAGRTATNIVVTDAQKGISLVGEKKQSTRLTGAVSCGDVSLPVGSTAGFESDDHVMLTSDKVMEYRNIPNGEIQQLTRVDTSTLKIPDTGALYDYGSDETVTVTKIEGPSNVTIRDIAITAADLDTYRIGVMLKYADRVLIENCRIGYISAMGIHNRSSTNVVVQESDFFKCAYPDSGYGYGIAVNGAARNMRVDGCKFREFKKHGTAVGGAPYEGKPTLIYFTNNTYYRNDADIHTGGLSVFENNRFLGNKSGILTGSDTTIVANNTFKNINNAAISDRGNPNELYVHCNQFENIGGHVFALYKSPSRLNCIRVSGNTFKDIGGNVMRHRAAEGTVAGMVVFSDNMVENVDGFVAYSEDGSGDLREYIATGNVVHTVTGNVVFGTDDNNAEVEISNNQIFNVENPYVLIARGAANSVKNNLVSDYSDHALLVWGSAMVSGNAFRWGDDSAVIVSRGSDVGVIQNEFSGTAGVDVDVRSNVENVTVALNQIHTKINASDAHITELNF